jgi:twinkle protein
MTKKYVEKIPHICGTKRGLQVFLESDGRYTGYCYSCNTYVKDPYADFDDGYSPPKPSIKSKEETQKELNGIARFPQEALPLEKITEETVKHFGVRLGFDQETASEVRSHYYPYFQEEELLAFQVKILPTSEHPKKFFSVGEFDKCDPFGWKEAKAAGGRKLFITEGQKDCMALWQVLKTSGKGEYTPAVISLPNGVKSVDKMARYIKDFDRWAEVVLCFDMDDKGKDAVKRFCKLYPISKVATIPLKDAHDMLMAGREQELFQAVMFRAKTQLSDKLKRSSEVWDLASQRPKEGISWPWSSLTAMTRGIRRGEGSYWGAGVKMGKSCIVNEIGAHLIVEHNLPVFFCKPEEENHITAQKLAGVATNAVFHDPRKEFDMEAFERGKRLIDDKAIMYGEYGKVEWTDLKREIRYVTQAEGVQDVIIDPITCLTVGMGSGEANERLVEIASELASMSKELHFTYYVFCHLNAPQSGLPHERGGKVLSMQFAGSRSMMR